MSGRKGRTFWLPCKRNESGEEWLRMLRERNDCTHIYNGDMAKLLVQNILDIYIPKFQKMDQAVAEKIKEEL